jgi:DNA primase
MENQLEEIKHKIDIIALINGYVPLKKAGRNYKALCPFHSEKTPSFMVSPDRQIFKCFGCNEGGDAFEFVKKIDGVEFGDAVRKLADRAGVELKEYKPSGIEKRRERIFSINQTAAELYNYLLTKHRAGRAALDYLHSRKINEASIKKFQLGFAPEKGDIAVSFLLKKGFPSEDISLAGHSFSTDRSKLFDRFRGRIIFPIKDTQGRVSAFSGRALGSREPKYLNSPDTIVFSKSKSLYGVDLAKTEINKQKTAILVEGNLDVISSHQVGVNNAVAPLGTALTEKQIDILRRFSDDLIIGFDTDFAGNAAARRGIELAEEAGFSVKVIELEEGKDPDDLIRKNPNAWKKKVKEAVSIYDFILDTSLKKWDQSTADGKKKISKEILPVIAKLPDEIARDHYVQKIAALLRVSEDAVRSDLKKYVFTSQRDAVEQGVPTPSKDSKINILERYLLALILQTGGLPKKITESFFSQRDTASLFTIIKKYVEKKGRLRLKELSAEIPENLLQLYDDLVLYGMSEKVLDYHEEAEREISSCIARIKELNLRTKLRKLGLEIKQAEAVSESKKIKSLTEQFRDLSLELSHLKTGK